MLHLSWWCQSVLKKLLELKVKHPKTFIFFGVLFIKPEWLLCIIFADHTNQFLEKIIFITQPQSTKTKYQFINQVHKK